MASQTRTVALAFLLLTLSTAFLSSRYYESAAFERPFHFSTITLLITGVSLYVWWWWWSRHHLTRPVGRDDALCDDPSSQHAEPPLARGPVARRVAFLLGPLLKVLVSPLLLPAICIIVRTVLFWRTIRTIHCSWDGLESFLPFAIAVYEFRKRGPVLLPSNAHKTPRWPALGRFPLAPFIALAWGVAAVGTMLVTEQTTGAICPPDIPERLVPVAQLLMVFCDAFIITRVGRLRRNDEDGNGAWRALATLFLSSAAALAFLAFWSSLDRVNFRWNVALRVLAIQDLLLDSAAATVALISAVSLLRTAYPAAIAVTVTGTNIFIHLQREISDGTLARTWSSPWGLITSLVLFLGTGYLLQHAGHSLGSTISLGNEGPFYRSRFAACSMVVFLIITAEAVLGRYGETSFDAVVAGRIVQSRASSNQWIEAANRSNTLDEATTEYARRYGIPPPPNFDKWYQYAVEAESPIIDDFEQIHRDLLPFWGVEPSLLRERTVHLLQHPSLFFGGLIIEGGKVDISPHIQGSHRWMMEEMRKMIEPFAEWLPDMQLSFNLNDECRVSVPFDDIETYQKDGLDSRARLASRTELDGFSSTLNPPWSKEYLSLDRDHAEALWKQSSPSFTTWSKSSVFYEWVSSTCPADAPVNRLRWWNRKAACPSCAAPHTHDGVISNWTLSGDLCHQPDLAYLHGFLSSPSAMVLTHTLFPVFSQSRMHNFADILYPSPWNFAEKVAFEDKKAIPWHEKLNSVYWRGALSDGYATHGAWQTFVRARFVHAAQRLQSCLGSSSLAGYIPSGWRWQPKPSLSAGRADSSTGVAVNVSFVGDFQRCDQRDCAAERTTFYGSPAGKPPPSMDFQEHWRHRHLIDFDGAGFSGRFPPFVESASLPYRAGLFRTWWEERLHAWRHFVPVDVRLTNLWGLVGYFGGAGEKEARRIAADGSEWAKKALRKEDMRVYMFRLLLEWGRIVDDRREELGFITA